LDTVNTAIILLILKHTAKTTQMNDGDYIRLETEKRGAL